MFHLPRHFVTFVLSHPVAKEFLAWARGMKVPDETAVQVFLLLYLYLNFLLFSSIVFFAHIFYSFQTLITISSMTRRGESWVVEQVGEQSKEGAVTQSKTTLKIDSFLNL